MTLNISNIKKYYEEFSQIDPKCSKKQNEWLGRHWMHADGHISESSCLGKILSKFFLTNWVFRIIKGIDLNQSGVIYSNSLDENLKNFAVALKFITDLVKGKISQNDKSKGMAEVITTVQNHVDTLKCIYMFQRFKAYQSKNSSDAVHIKNIQKDLDTLEKSIKNFDDLIVQLNKTPGEIKIETLIRTYKRIGPFLA